MQVKDDSIGQIEFDVSIDSTIARAHQHAAARKRGTTAGRSIRSDRETGRRSDDPAED
uniref:hypothetical protein n=1 Tax=Nonomuraea bangladeshensis TaxID=404385 RepID=UPI003F499F2D